MPDIFYLQFQNSHQQKLKKFLISRTKFQKLHQKLFWDIFLYSFVFVFICVGTMTLIWMEWKRFKGMRINITRLLILGCSIIDGLVMLPFYLFIVYFRRCNYAWRCVVTFSMFFHCWGVEADFIMFKMSGKLHFRKYLVWNIIWRYA